MAYRIVAKSPKHLNDIVEDIMSWFETARDYRVEFDNESRKFADPATKQIVTKKIDVLHVQDPMTGKKTVIKFIPLLRPEEMKIEMGGENEHVMKGKMKNMMKGRGEFKTYNKDTLRKMSESDATTLLKQLGQELKSHDWTYQYSDDPKYYDRGSREWESIRNIISQINKMGLQTDGEAIWKQFAPSDQKNNYPNKMQESKMKISEFKKMIREEIRKVLKEDVNNDLEKDYTNGGLVGVQYHSIVDNGGTIDPKVVEKLKKLFPLGVYESYKEIAEKYKNYVIDDIEGSPAQYGQLYDVEGNNIGTIIFDKNYDGAISKIELKNM